MMGGSCLRSGIVSFFANEFDELLGSRLAKAKCQS